MSQRIPKISASASAMSGEFAKSTVVYPCRTISGSVACPSDLSLLKSDERLLFSKMRRLRSRHKGQKIHGSTLYTIPEG
ncbi:BnaC03g61430D [Brassica napus]|uniref:BnaC03g61430D protein n=1 Tax=Brassica napus TaxID=3708 RepID=A0A078G7F2_BRANA|nr:BnaC03g61430D [Brassica napus]